MISPRYETLTLTIILWCSITSVSSAQTSSISWFKINDTAGGHDSLEFGNHRFATYGVDGALGENSSPPDPPNFFAKWISIPGRINTWGLGLIPKDLRDSVGAARKDTFQLYFKNDDSAAENPYTSVTLQWPNRSYLSLRCDSMFLEDPTGTILSNRVDMFAQDQVTLTGVYDSNGTNPRAPFVKLFIYKYAMHFIECGAYPEVMTYPASDVGTTTAIVHGVVDSYDPIISVEFQYGTSNSYGSEIDGENLFRGTYQASLNGLSPATTYHYRMVAFTVYCGDTMTTVGNDDAFTTGSQTSSIFWINVSDSVSPYDHNSSTMTFGNHIDATYGVDSALGENACRPGCETLGFATLWLSIPGRTNTWGGALLLKDLRDFSSTTKKDTFLLFFKDDDSLAESVPNVSAVLRWPQRTYLSQRCDSMFLVDPSGYVMPQRVDMFAQDSVVLTGMYYLLGNNPSAPLVKLLIYKYGTHLPFLDGVHRERISLPDNFALLQNYPNPFNPTTTVQLDVPAPSFVSLKLYDVLGRGVKTLVENKHYEAGRYEETVDASGLPSGVYFYRMIAQPAEPGGRLFQSVKKMILVR